MKKGEEFGLNNVYVGNVIKNIPVITKKVLAKKYNIPEFIEEWAVEELAQNVAESVFWTVSFGTFRLRDGKYCKPTGILAGMPRKYNFEDDLVRDQFFYETNKYAFDTEKKEGEKRYAMVGTNNPGKFSDDIRKNAHLFDGIKFGSFRKLQLNTPDAQKSMQELAEVCKENNWPMLIHTSIGDFKSNEGLEGIYKLAKENSEVNFCVSHMGGDISKWKDEDYRYYLKERFKCINEWEEIPENMYFNTAVTDLKLVGALLKEFPGLKKKVVLASDVPFAFKTFEEFENSVWDTFKTEEVEQFNENALQYGNNE